MRTRTSVIAIFAVVLAFAFGSYAQDAASPTSTTLVANEPVHATPVVAAPEAVTPVVALPAAPTDTVDPAEASAIDNVKKAAIGLAVTLLALFAIWWKKRQLATKA